VNDINQLPDHGTIQIDDEVMSYDGKEALLAAGLGGAASGQPGLLLNVERGLNGTAPASHQHDTIVVLLAVPTPSPTTAVCTGDCNGTDGVSTAELLTIVNIALGNAPAADCLRGDPSSDRQIGADEIVTAVNRALDECQ